MTPRERILAALRWEEPDQIPLTSYEWILPRGYKSRLLRNDGVALVCRLPAHKEDHKECEIIRREYWENGLRHQRRTIKTPVGEIYQTLEFDEFGYQTSDWIKEHFIKGPEDYPVMEYFIKDTVLRDNFEIIKEMQRRMADDALVYVRIFKSPIQEMLYQMMGFEQFSIDYFENRELFDSLHSVMLDHYREIAKIAARAPVEVILIGDNVSSEVVGTERFNNYLIPVYTMLQEEMKGTGKLIGSHMDGRLASLADAVAKADLHWIEALTPPPMGDFSLADARKLWKDKAMWINFTSNIHIEKPEVIEAHTRELIEQAGSKKGFLIGVTEDAPIPALERSLEIIQRVIKEY